MFIPERGVVATRKAWNPRAFLLSSVRAHIDAANGLEISRTQKEHPHGTTNRITVELALVRGLADNEVIVNPLALCEINCPAWHLALTQ